jgi:protein-S-isoprenylcysteine O-methyltransferase Ste14
MRSRVTGIIGTVLGLILAILGVFLWFLSTPVHHKLGPGFLVVGIILLAFGAWAYRGSAKARAA